MNKGKICLILFLWIILGFILGVAFVGFGFIVTMMFKVFSVWKIGMFTLLGMAVILAYSIESVLNEKE